MLRFENNNRCIKLKYNIKLEDMKKNTKIIQFYS